MSKRNSDSSKSEENKKQKIFQNVFKKQDSDEDVDEDEDDEDLEEYHKRITKLNRAQRAYCRICSTKVTKRKALEHVQDCVKSKFGNGDTSYYLLLVTSDRYYLYIVAKTSKCDFFQI